MNNTVKLKKYLDIIKERTATAAILPGELVEQNGASGCRPHSTEDGAAAKIFALEDELQGNGLSDSYAVGDRVQLWYAVPGEEVYAILEDGENCGVDDFLVSNGNGHLKVYVPATESIGADSSANISTFHSNRIVAQALEAIDLSGSSGEESSGEGTVDPVLYYHRRIKVVVV